MTMTSRAFLIHMMALFMLSICITGNCLAQNDEKPTYKYTDNRISLADTLLSHKDYARALEAYKVALKTYKTESFYEGMVYATERMAFCYRRLKNDGLSAETFQQAIDLAKEKLEPNHMLLSKAYLNNGIRAHFKNTYFQAADLIDSSKAIFDRSRVYEPNTYQKIIEYKFYTYYYAQKSHDTLIKYLDIRSHLLQEPIEANKKIYLLNDFSRAYNYLGDYKKATAYATEAYRLCLLEDGNVEPYYHSDALFSLSRSFLNQNKYQKALEVCNELIEYTLINNPNASNLRGFYNLKGVILNGLKKYREASDEFKKAIHLLEFAGKKNNPLYDISTGNLGLAYLKDQKPKLSKYYLDQALNSSRGKHSYPSLHLSPRFRDLAYFFEAQGKFRTALNYYDSAFKSHIQRDYGSIYTIPIKSISRPNYKTLETLIERTCLFSKIYTNHQSSPTLLRITLEHTDKIHHLILQNRQLLKTSNGKIHLNAKFKDLYQAGVWAAQESYFQTGNDEHYVEQGIKNITRGKSVLFLEQRWELLLLSSIKDSPQLRDELSSIIFVNDSLDNQINQQIALDPLGDSVMILNTEKMKWNARLAKVRETIEKEYPDAGNDFFSREVSIESLRADHQLSSEKALVEYFVGDSAIFVVGLSGQKTSFHRIEKNELFNTALSSFLGEVNTAPDSREMGLHLQSFGEASHALYNALLKPVLDDLGTMENLIIVPDEILSRVPFELLISKWSGRETSFKELDYLLKDTKVSHLLSSKISFNEFTQSQGKGMLGFGYTGQGVTDERAAMGGLPGALKEINFLRSNFEGDYYIGNEGTKRQFLKKAGDYDVIHLALHGVSDSVNRYNSALVFNGDQDYYMTSTDLYRTRLKSKLAVLSACETGIGKISEGEGSFSIARGFAIAGVPAIVTTLWKVNDQAGASIMEQFYLNLQAGNKKDDALRQAKLTYLQKADNLSSSPFYWGNYILIGDSREIELREKENLPWHWLLITIIVLGSLGLGLRRLSRKSFYQAS